MAADISKPHPGACAIPAQRAPLVLGLDEVSGGQLGAVGGKAANLAALVRAGMPVPRGFCVTTAAFEQFLASAPEQARLSELLSSGSTARVDQVGRLSWEAQSCLARAVMPLAVREAVLAAWRELGDGGRYAVRSSATVEDAPERSFAGQFESVLNTRGPEAVLEAIKVCWRSLFTERALLYLARRAVPVEQVKMAVLVQEMVKADCSGVLFTADPLSGAADRFVLEWVPGLGDGLVQGTRAPERMVVDKLTRRVLAPDNGSELMPEAGLGRLLELAAQTERILGAPQDIEWARRDGEVWLLQSRFITTGRSLAKEPDPGRDQHDAAGARPSPGAAGSASLGVPASSLPPLLTTAAAPEEGRAPLSRRTSARQALAEVEIWSNLNAVENLPEVVTPLSWSLLQFGIQRCLGPVQKIAGVDPVAEPWLGLVAGRVYMNVGVVLKILRCLPGFRGERLAWVFGGHQDSLTDALERQSGVPRPSPRMRIVTILRVLRLTAGFLWVAQWRSSRQCLGWLTAWVDGFVQLDCRRLSADDLFERLNSAEGELLRHPPVPVLFGLGVICHGLFRRGCRKWFGDRHGTVANRLLSRAGGMASAEPGLALWRMAAWALKDGSLRSALQTARSFAELSAVLSATASGREFLGQWDEFMRHHGHHAAGEVDIAAPRWSERPDDVLRLLQGYLDGAEQRDPAQLLAERTRERERVLAECRARLRHPLKRWWFCFLLRQTQEWVVLRENAKSEIIRGLAAFRRIFLELGERLARQGRLERADDIFFLTVEEYEPVYRGTALFDARAAVRARRAEFERNRALTPPAVVIGQFDPAQPTLPVNDPVEGELQGLPVSAGVVTGTARVMLRPDGQTRILPGEILVAPFTDPGWTPHFLTAAGLVTEIGGQLSHGSVIAREYGLPAVVNVPSATKLIHTGDLIQVDGDRGRVTILARGSASASASGSAAEPRPNRNAA